MATKPLLILDQHFRTKEELFSEATFTALSSLCDISGGVDAPMPRAEIEALLPDAAFYVAAKPELHRADLARAVKLRAIIEVAGAFRAGVAYEAGLDRGVEILSCSPGFQNAVAEMTVAMILAAGRGLVAEHEAFRAGTERWLADREETDFSLYRQSVGFIGYGQISREAHRLMRPFNPQVMAYDPYLTDAVPDVALVSMEQLVTECRVVVVAAVPSADTRGLLSAALIDRLQQSALVVVISRAWCTDFAALTSAAAAGKIQLATDVFPDEPLPGDHPLRRMRNIILSPHRAAAVPRGRHPIGDMILHDVQAILQRRPERQLKPANRALLAGLIAAQNQLNPVPNT